MSLASEGKLTAPLGKFRVIGVDLFEAWDADYLVGDFEDLETALEAAKQRNHPEKMNVAYVYNDSGTRLYPQ